MLIIALILAFGMITIRGLFTVGNLTRTIYEHPLVVSNASLSAALNLTKMHRNLQDAVFAGTSELRDEALRVAAQNQDQIYRQLDIVRAQILGDEGQTLEKETRQLFDDWQPLRDSIEQDLKSGHQLEAIEITKTTGADHLFRLENKMLELTAYARNKADSFLNMAESRQSRLEHITILLTICGVVLSVLIAAITTVLVSRAEKNLQAEKRKLQDALIEIRTLRGIIPICAHCKQIRDDEGSWRQVEEYIHAHSEAEFSHSVCPSCVKKYYAEYLEPSHTDGPREEASTRGMEKEAS